ncbi:MAG: hypothetical protein PHR82_09380 [Endomicrobiaceae bacterium]|jgi:hypothetical protein|nr:hypothetical protein [Endomicrobiaceae bacterium]
MIQLTDKIGYIQHYLSPERYKYIEAKITRINIGKKKTSVYSDRFNALDVSELESNTVFAKRGLQNNFIMVQEPFITNDELRAQAERWCENTNKKLEEENNG